MSRREQFIEWLEKRVKYSATAKYYAECVEEVGQHYAKENTIGEIYQINDVKLISKISNEYRKKGKYEKEGNNPDGGGWWRAAIKKYADFVADQLVGGVSESEPENSRQDTTITNFGYEKDLEAAVCSQISSLFPNYEFIGSQYPIQLRRIDVLLQHENKDELLIVELKAGEANEAVFGQISMYIGMLQQKPEFSDKKIRGLIIASTIGKGLRYACNTNPDISIKTYRMALELEDLDSPELE